MVMSRDNLMAKPEVSLAFARGLIRKLNKAKHGGIACIIAAEMRSNGSGEITRPRECRDIRFLYA